MASRAENSTATQNRPAVARSSTWRSGSSANAKSTSTSRANGRDLVEGDPAAGLDPQVAAGDEGGVTPHGCLRLGERRLGGGRRRRRPPAAGHARSVVPPASVDDPVGQRRGPVELVGRQDHRRPLADGLRGRARRAGRGPSASSPAWGSSSSHSSGRRASRQASDVRRRWPADSRATGTSASRPASPTSGQRGVDVGVAGPAGPAPERDVLGDGEVVVQAGGVAEQPDPAADGPGVGPQVVAQHQGLAPHDRHQPRAGAQQRRLACAVGAAEQDDLARARRRGRCRRARGTVRAARRRRGGGRPAP